MIKRFGFFMATLFCVVGGAFAQQVSQNVALRNASDFYSRLTSQHATPSLLKTVSMPAIHLAATGGSESSPEYYVYNIGDKQGFMVVSGDEQMDPIVLYTLGGSFEAFQQQPLAKNFLEGYTKIVQEVRSGNRVGTLRSMWAVPLAGVTERKSLTKTRWDQEAPYNLMLADPEGGTPYFTGCVATALAQVLKYHSYPARANAVSKQVTYKNGSNRTWRPMVQLGTEDYEWDKMLDVYPDATKAPNRSDKDNEHNRAVAHLMKEAGAAVSMSYVAGVGSGSKVREAARRLKDIFGYSNSIEYAYKLTYTDKEWAELLRQEIDAKRPVLEGAAGDRGDHAFVCDGYDNDGFFSYNMGWGTEGAKEPIWTKEWGGMSYHIDPSIIIGITPKTEGVEPVIRYQVAMHTSLNLSSQNLLTSDKFSAIFQVANYGLNDYKGKCALGLYQDGILVHTLGAQLMSSPKANSDDPIGEGSKNLQLILVSFNDVAFPDDVKEGRYTLRAVLQLSDNTWVPMLALAKDVLNNVGVTISEDKHVDISYPTSSNVSPLTLVSDVNIAMSASNIGTARFHVTNVDSLDYKYNGKIYVLAQKVGATGLLPEVMGSVDVKDLGLGEVRELEVGNLVAKPGVYTYFVGYSPASKDGEGKGAVPLLPASKNFYRCSVPEEVAKETWDFKKDAIPATFKRYENETENNAVWGADKMIGNAISFFGEKGVDTHTLVTSAIYVPDENAVLEWRISAFTGKGIIPYEVYISTIGSDIANFKGVPVYRVNNIYEPKVSDVYRTSLSAYKGQNIYIAIKHFNTDMEGSGICIDHIRMLDIKAPKNVSLLKMITPTSCKKGESQDITIVMKNRSPLTFNKLKAIYTVNNGTPVEEEVSADFLYDTNVEYTFKTPVMATEGVGEQRTIDVKVVLEGEDPALLTDNILTTKSQVMNFIPSKNYFIGKYVMSSCTGCRLSSSYLNQFEARSPSTFNGIEVWYDTSLSAMDTPFKSYSSWGTPMFTLNGPKNILPLLGSYTGLWVDNFNNIINQKQTVADITTEASFDATDSRLLHIKLTTRFALPAKGKYSMTAYVIENGVQSSGTAATEGHWYNHIPVGVTSSGIFGFEENPSVITDPTVDGVYVYETTYKIPEPTETRFNPDDIQVIGLLFDAKGSVENSSVDLHYVRFKLEDGLNFVSENGCRPFISVTEQDLQKNTYGELKMLRATVKNGENFVFRLEKTGKYAGKNVRVFSDYGGKEELYPDAAGVYTINNLNSHIYLTVKQADNVIENTGSVYTFNGEWTSQQLSEVNLPATATVADLTGITIPTTVEPLKIANPNCLIYLAEDAMLPSSWNLLPNVVKGAHATKVELSEGYAFGSTNAFIADEISYTSDFSKFPTNSWTTLSLPFIPSNGDLSGLVIEKFIAFLDGEAKFESAQSLEANIPYAVQVLQSQKKTFNGWNVSVPVTTTGVGNGFQANYAPKVATSDLYRIASDGASFVRCGGAALPSFTGYIRYSDSSIDAIPVKRSGEVVPNFTLVCGEKMLKDGDVLNIEMADITEDEFVMKFPFKILAKVEMKVSLKREVLQAAQGQWNEICMGICYAPEINETQQIDYPNENGEEVATYATCHHPADATEATTVRYTFDIAERSGAKYTLSVTVNYNASATSSALYRIEENGKLLVLSGKWKAEDFKNLDLSSLDLTCIDMGAITIPANAPLIEIQNPNCLIYVADGATIPYSWKNVVKGDQSDAVILKAGNSFTNLKPFTARTMQVEYDFSALAPDAKAFLVLPFDYLAATAGLEAEAYQSFNGTSVEFGPVTQMEANIPYLVKPLDAEKNLRDGNAAMLGKRIFNAENVTVPVTGAFVAPVSGMSFTWVKASKAVSGLYTLSANGTAFERVAPNSVLPPWTSVLKLPAGCTLNSYSILSGTVVGTEGINSLRGLLIESKGGIVTIRSGKACQIQVTRMDGRVVRQLRVEEGITELQGLPIGIYLINTQKVVVGY